MIATINETTFKGIPMDISLLSALATSLNVAKDLGKAATSIRDFNQLAPVVSQLNEQILKAQETLFAHNTQLLALQQEQFETAKKLREMEEALSERGRYSLVEIAPRVFVYRVNVTPVTRDVGDPVSTQPVHHLCQPCFDGGIKSVLQGHGTRGNLRCLKCSTVYILDAGRDRATGAQTGDGPEDLGPHGWMAR